MPSPVEMLHRLGPPDTGDFGLVRCWSTPEALALGEEWLLPVLAYGTLRDRSHPCHQPGTRFRRRPVVVEGFGLYGSPGVPFPAIRWAPSRSVVCDVVVPPPRHYSEALLAYDALEGCVPWAPNRGMFRRKIVQVSSVWLDPARLGVLEGFGLAPDEVFIPPDSFAFIYVGAGIFRDRAWHQPYDSLIWDEAR